MSVCVCVCVCLSVFVCVCLSLWLHDNSKNNGSIHLKLEHIVVYENSADKLDIGHCLIKVKVLGQVPHWALSDQGQGQGVTLKFFSIYHNTNCQVLYLSFGTC